MNMFKNLKKIGEEVVNELQPEEFPGHKYVKQKEKNNTVIGKEHEQRNTGRNEVNRRRWEQ